MNPLLTTFDSRPTFDSPLFQPHIYTITFRWNDTWQTSWNMTSATAGTIGGLPITSVTSASADTGNEAWRIWLAAPTGWRSGIGSYSTISPYNESSTQWVAVDFGANPVWITGYILAGDATCTIDAYCIEYSANASTWTKINASDVINAVIYNNPTTTTW